MNRASEGKKLSTSKEVRAELIGDYASAVDTSEFAQTGLGGEGFNAQGFDTLSSYQLQNCCKPCKECQVDLARRGPDYRECDGTALRDTQSKHCVNKCPFGTHQVGAQENSTCVRCQECFVGESDTRDLS